VFSVWCSNVYCLSIDKRGVKLGLDRMLRNRLSEEKGLQHFLSDRGKNEGRKEISLSRLSTSSRGEKGRGKDYTVNYTTDLLTKYK